MSSLDKPFKFSAGKATRLPDDVCIVASPHEIEGLRAEMSERSLAEPEMRALGPTAPLSTETISRASVLVMEVDQNNSASLRRVDQVRTLRPSLPIIVALRDANIAAVRTLIRQGVEDVCSLPFDFDELYGQLYDLTAKLRDTAAARIPSAPLVAVVRSTGGSGATSVATHLSAELAKSAPDRRSACLIDLDIQFGNVASALGCESGASIVNLLESGSRLDAELLFSAAVSTGRGFDLIGAPAAITPLETIEVDQLLQLLVIARREYGAVIVDLPANWTNWTLSTVLAATDVLMVTELTIAGLRQTKRRLDLFESVGVRPELVRVVVNRVEKRLFRTIGMDEVEQALGHPVFAKLTLEQQLLASAQDQGMLSWEANRKSKFAADIAALAADLKDAWAG